MITLILFASFFVLLLIGVPIAICLGASSALAVLYASATDPQFANLSLSIVATNTYTGISKFLLLAIPFFVLSGDIMAKAGISKRLVKFIDDMCGHRCGGMAITCVIVSCFFGAISGSGPATVAALGAVLIPAMIASGFSPSFSEGLMATSSSIAIVIPPSIAFVVYASITGQNVGEMFIAGIIPGILMGLALIIVVLIEARRKGIKAAHARKTWKERWHSFQDAFWGLLMPVIILGGIYGGIFTPTEAAAVSVVYGLFVGMFIYKEIKVKDLLGILVGSAKTSGSIMMIVASASLFSYCCTLFGISQSAQALLAFLGSNKIVFLLIVNIIFLIAGCFLDANSAMYIFIPIMAPVAESLGYSLVAFGIVATVNLAIGQVTPPVGVNLFVALGLKVKDEAASLKAKADKFYHVTLPMISKAVLPMILACLIVLATLTYVPKISTIFAKDKGGEVANNSGKTSSAKTNLEYKDYMGSDEYVAKYDAAKYTGSDEWPTATWNFDCSTGESSTWAQAGYYFNALMQESTGGKVKVDVYPGEQLTNGDQVAGIQALMDGDPIQVSLHSNLIYANFDPRFNVVSLPYIYNDYDDVDAVMSGAGGDELKELLDQYGIVCGGIAENGFRQITNSKQPIKSVDDLKSIKMRICSNDLCSEVYKEWNCDASAMNWSETYTALQQGTVDGQENPETAIASASVQDVQKYISLWNAYYDCLFFGMNKKVFEQYTPEQQAVILENMQKATNYEKAQNRKQVDELVEEWKTSGEMEVTTNDEIDSESFKEASAGAADWYKEQLLSNKDLGLTEEQVDTFVDAFTNPKKREKLSYDDYQYSDKFNAVSQAAVYDGEDEWPASTWNFDCSTGESSSWAQAGKYFNALMQESTGGKVKVDVYPGEQLTNGDQVAGIQALMDGDTMQVSLHSNLIYANFDPRFNVVSLPYIYENYDDVDAVMSSEGGQELKDLLNDYGLVCGGIGENGFRQITNSKQPIKSVTDLKSVKMRICSNDLCSEVYKEWGCDASAMNWAETYTALQQGTVDGQENPETAIASASVQDVQDYISLWNAYYDCLFFCINKEVYDQYTPDQQAVILENMQKAADYQKNINRIQVDQTVAEWTESGAMEVTPFDEIDSDSFKNSCTGVVDWYINQLESNKDLGLTKDQVEEFVAAFTDTSKRGTESSSSSGSVTGGDGSYWSSDVYDATKEAARYEGTDEWPEMTLNYDCSTGEQSTWAQAGYYFNALMQETTGGKVKIDVYPGEQLTNGDQVAGIQALMDGDPIQVSMHSNLIYANFDPRFNVVSLPYQFADYDAVDKAMNGAGGQELKDLLKDYGLVCGGIGENGFRQITNSKQPIKSVDDLKSVKMRISSNDLSAEIYKEWGCSASAMNWAETYTALQQGTIDGQENPVTAIASASVQDVQDYISLWDAYYDCLFFCMNEDVYNQFTPEQQKAVSENMQKAADYEKAINRAQVEEVVANWQKTGDMQVTTVDEIDSNSFKKASEGAYPWFESQIEKSAGMSEDDAKSFVEAFQ